MRVQLLSVACMMMMAATAVAVPELQREERDEGLDGHPAWIVPNEIVVGFHDAVPTDVSEWVRDLDGEVLLSHDEARWISARFPIEAAADAALRAASARDDVAWAEHDRYMQLLGTDGFTPNDALYSQQWGMEAIHVPGAWNDTLGSHDVKIAIVDSGIDVHPDLYGNLCGPHKSYTGDSPHQDPSGHGTHVAGIAAASTNNGVGVAGVSQSCLMSVKVMDDGPAQESWIAGGILWSTHQGADIISMSLGSQLPPFYEPSQAFEDAVNAAYAQNVLLIAGAGNHHCASENTVAWPARFPAVMAVANLNISDESSAYYQSSCGPAVEITAPGVDTTSTLPLGNYGNKSGTSMSTPHVSGVAALMKSVAANMSARDIRSVLNETADDIEAPGWDYKTGWGRVNATAAVARALEIANGT